MSKVTKTILCGVVFFILTSSIIFQARIIKNLDVISLSSYKSDDLINEFFKWKNKYENANKKIQEQEETLNIYEQNNR